MPDCICEPCGDHCSCKCHKRSKSLIADGGLIAAEPADDPPLP